MYLYFFLYLYLFLLHPIDNTLIVQYQLVQGWLNYVYIIKKENSNGEGHIIENKLWPFNKIEFTVI